MNNKEINVALVSFAVIGALAVATTMILFAVAACPEFIEYG